MNFFKNLFTKPPIEQRKLNLGKLTAKATLKNGEILYYKFEGEYRRSEDFSAFGQNTWYDLYETAKEDFENWKKHIAESKFLKRDATTYLPISDIVEISIEEQDHFVETDRKY